MTMRVDEMAAHQKRARRTLLTQLKRLHQWRRTQRSANACSSSSSSSCATAGSASSCPLSTASASTLACFTSSSSSASSADVCPCAASLSPSTSSLSSIPSSLQSTASSSSSSLPILPHPVPLSSSSSSSSSVSSSPVSSPSSSTSRSQHKTATLTSLDTLLSSQPQRCLFIHGLGPSACSNISPLEINHVITTLFGPLQTTLSQAHWPFILCRFMCAEHANACRMQWHMQKVVPLKYRLLLIDFLCEDAFDEIEDALKIACDSDAHSDEASMPCRSEQEMPNASYLQQLSPISHYASYAHCTLDLRPEFASLASSPLSLSPSLLRFASLPKPLIHGLLLIDNFVSEEEEQRLLSFLNSQVWTSYRSRSVQHYGHAFDYNTNDVLTRECMSASNSSSSSSSSQANAIKHLQNEQKKNGSVAGTSQESNVVAKEFEHDWQAALSMFPAEFESLLCKLRYLPLLPQLSHHTLSGCLSSFPSTEASSPAAVEIDAHNLIDQRRELTQFIPNQLTVNRYKAGDGIPPHVDTHSAFTHMVLSLSLAAEIVMDFNRSLRIVLPRRSLLIFAHEARYNLVHAITARKTDRIDYEVRARQERISLTFRRLRAHPQCYCRFHQMCDSAMAVKKKERSWATTARSGES